MTFKEVAAWVWMQPKIYYKDGEPYGLLGTRDIDGVIWIAATVEDIDDPFTFNMIKDIIMLYKKNRVCLVTDTPAKQKQIRSALDRYGFTHEVKDGIMYSQGGLSD